MYVCIIFFDRIGECRNVCSPPLKELQIEDLIPIKILKKKKETNEFFFSFIVNSIESFDCFLVFLIFFCANPFNI